MSPSTPTLSRPAARAHSGKSDASDAYLLADLLRTDGHRFKPLAPSPTRSARCAPWYEVATIWVATRVHLANQLRVLLQS